MGALDGKVAIVTGAAQGIGRAIVERFAREGAQVTLGDVNDALGQQVVDGVKAAGGSAQYVHCDVAQEADVSAMVAQTAQAFGGVDIMINNAAFAIYKLIHEYTPEEWDRVVAVDLKSVYLTSRFAIPLMIQRGAGSIVNIASAHARTTSTMNAPYVASKGGIISLTRAMALEGAPHNIRVNCILPGTISTPMLMENWTCWWTAASPHISINKERSQAEMLC
jgi:NAD(P)-dependent dehydrogenase (short-subunit alcohol dehydrogenase family)